MAAVKLVTRCPACRTAFRVVADQLLLRQGLVRCGQCETVFDARVHLVEVPVRPPATPTFATPSAHASPAPSSSALSAFSQPFTDASPNPPVQAGSELVPHAQAADAEDHVDERDERHAQDEPDEPVRHEPPLPFDPGYDVPALDAPTMLLELPDESPPAAPDDEIQWDKPFPSIHLPDELADGAPVPPHGAASTSVSEHPTGGIDASGERASPDRAAQSAGETGADFPPAEAIFIEGKSDEPDDRADGRAGNHATYGAQVDGAGERHEPEFPPAFPPEFPPEFPPASAPGLTQESRADDSADDAVSPHAPAPAPTSESDQANTPREEPIHVAGHYLRARDPDGPPAPGPADDAGNAHADTASNEAMDNAGWPDPSATDTGTDRIEPRMRDYSRHDEPPIRLYAPDFLRHPATGEPEQGRDLPFRSTLRREPPRETATRSRGRWVWPAVIVLGAAAVLQGAFLARSQLAGSFPLLRPLLEAACEPLGCMVKPWRDIEALRIETSQLQKLDEGSDEYVLGVTLRNQGRADVALPAIELVMTDLQDQLLLRRVLPVEEYLAPDQRQFAVKGLRAGMELPVRVRFRSQQTAANYRVLILYP